MQGLSPKYSWSMRSAPLPRPEASASAIAGSVSTILAAASDGADYLTTKMALDHLIDPSTDGGFSRAEVDRLVAAARQRINQTGTFESILNAIREVIYKAGPWNDHRPFAYDQGDPLGQAIQNKLLSTYLRTRRGNCVSMPILFLIVADRLGLDVGLATAPLHVFVCCKTETGRILRLETTSGAHPARIEWFQKHMPMSPRAIANGVYMRMLPPRETVALMATTVMEHLAEVGRLQDAIDVSDAILAVAPKDAYTLAKRGSFHGELMEREIRKYQHPSRMPPAVQSAFERLAHQNASSFAAAEALGWQAT